MLTKSIWLAKTDVERERKIWQQTDRQTEIDAMRERERRGRERDKKTMLTRMRCMARIGIKI